MMMPVESRGRSERGMLLALHQAWAEMIVGGRKTVDLRRARPAHTTAGMPGYLYSAGWLLGVTRLGRLRTLPPGE